MAKEAATRIYVIEERDAAGKVVAEHLAEAQSQAGAIRAVTQPRFTATPATGREIVHLMSIGVKVQT